MIRRLSASIVAIVALAASAFAGTSLAGEINGWFTIGNAKFLLGASYLPDRAPAKRFVAVKLKTWLEIEIDERQMPPRLDEIVLDLDENVRFARKGLGTCDPAQIASTTTKVAKRRCRSALIGKGRVETVVGLDGLKPFSVGGPLLIFNGVDQAGRPAVVLHARADVVIPTTYVIVAEMPPSPLPGYGTRVIVPIPEIAEGQGVLSGIKINLAKRPRKKRFLIARCPKERIKVEGDFNLHPEPDYPEGRDFHVSMVGSCLRKR